MHFSGPVYDVLKWITTVVLPAFGTAYFSLAALLHLPNGDQVSGIVLIVVTFLGVVLGISTSSYNKTEKFAGALNVETTPEGKKTISLELEGDPYELDQKSEVTFKVNKA